MRPRVLLVEDDFRLRDAICRSLSARGYQVQVAEDGVAALDALAQGEFQVMVTDIFMPRMDGVELMETLQNHGIGVVAMSGDTRLDGQFAKLVTSLGARKLLVKPFTISELESAIQEAVAP